jgi:hypothetical protein
MWRANQFHPFGFISASARSTRGLVGSLCLKFYYIFNQNVAVSIFMVNVRRQAAATVTGSRSGIASAFTACVCAEKKAAAVAAFHLGGWSAL